MKKLILVIQFFICIIESSNSQQPNHNEISDSYYHGTNKLFTSAFLKIAKDSAFVDLIWFEKYPRRLITDTLLFDRSSEKWVGKMATVYQKENKYYIEISNDLNDLPLFGKTNIELKPNEPYYKEVIDEYKNLAVLHMFHEFYLGKYDQSLEAKKRFRSLEEKYNMAKIKMMKHDDFLKQFKKFKSELE